MNTKPLPRWLGCAAVLCVVAAACWPAVATATDRALLIGVADYPALPKRLWLRGPINDVMLMRNTLIHRGFDPLAIQVLVSRAGGANEPTLANIQQAMGELKRQSQAGDRVILYFAGHGSQQPQPAQHGTRPTEPDGLDEVFLPADVRRWDGSGAEEAIPNALLDDEVGEWIDAVVDKGAKVWAVFDACHAGGMGRGRGRTQWRSVASDELGLHQLKKPKPGPTHEANRTDGRTLVFASRSHELTGEEWMPRNAPPLGSRVHGVFTFHLANALTRRTKVDAINMQEDLRNDYRQERRASPTPVFQGSLLQAWP